MGRDASRPIFFDISGSYYDASRPFFLIFRVPIAMLRVPFF